MNTEMLKEVLLCGIGMVIDLSGAQYFHSQQPNVSANDAIASDWKQVGHLLQYSVTVEGPKIEAEAKQLQLNLG